IPAAAVAPLQASQLQPIIAAAIQYWTALPGYRSDTTLLAQVPFGITPLSGAQIGQTIANTIVIDPTAKGFGWFVDPTPFDSTEFSKNGQNMLQAPAFSPAYGHMDLLTVVIHELGHVLGLDDINSPTIANDVMDTVLAAGQRRLPAYRAPSFFVSPPVPGLSPSIASSDGQIAATLPAAGSSNSPNAAAFLFVAAK